MSSGNTCLYCERTVAGEWPWHRFCRACWAALSPEAQARIQYAIPRTNTRDWSTWTESEHERGDYNGALELAVRELRERDTPA